MTAKIDRQLVIRVTAEQDAWLRARPGGAATTVRQLAMRAMQGDTEKPSEEGDAGPTVHTALAKALAPPVSEPVAASPALLERLDLLAGQVSELVEAVARLGQRIEGLAKRLGDGYRDLAGSVADLMDRVEDLAAASAAVPVGGEPVEREGPPPPAHEPEALAPVAMDAGSSPAPPPPADPPQAVPNLGWPWREPQPGDLVLGLWPVAKARVLLVDLDRVLHLTDAELVEHLAERGIPRPMFDNYLKRELGKWLEPAKVPPADPREAVAALAAELKAALASVEPEAVPGS